MFMVKLIEKINDKRYTGINRSISDTFFVFYGRNVHSLRVKIIRNYEISH